MKRLLLPIFILIALIGYGQILPNGFVVEEFVIGLSQPTAMAFAPDGRLFVAEKAGAVRIIENGKLLQEPFYQVETETPNERGLDGIVLDPHFDENQYVYLYYTALDERANKVARVTAAGNTAIPNTEIEIFRTDRLNASWHNGGAMLFGPDEKLYVAIGDGTDWTKAPRLDFMLGKIVRINPDGSIPEDNPLIAETDGIYQSIYAYGIRNPYTMGISRSGRIFFNDVGNQEFEEVNELLPAANYGWNSVEGHLMGPPPDSRYVDPLYVYDHSDEVHCAIVGAAFYEPENINFPPEYHGKYFFMDYCAGTVWSMNPNTNDVTLFGEQFDFPNNLVIGDDGGLYIMQIKTGQIFRISYQNSGMPFITRQPKTVKVAEGDNVEFRVEATGQDPLQFIWYRDGQVIPDANGPSLQVSDVMVDDDSSTYFVEVVNGLGSLTSDTAFLQVVRGTYPQTNIEITSGSKYRAGDTIFFTGSADDLEDGMLSSDRLTWTLEFHHDVHTHPAFGPEKGISSGFYPVGVFGEVDTNVFYRVHLQAEDLDGLVTQSSADVYPEKVTMHLLSEPEGIELNIDGLKLNTPVSVRSVANLQRTIEVPRYDIVSDHFYVFDRWADTEDKSLIRSFPAAEQLEIAVHYLDSGFYHTGDGTKLKVEYYVGNGMDTIYYNTQRKDVIDENWDVVSPYRWQADFPDDSFSVKWTGELVAPISALYTFEILHDSRVTLILDDEIIIDGAVDDSGIREPTTVSAPLTGGRAYSFQLFYEHFRDWARVRAAWSYSVVENELIPASQFQEKVITSDTIFLEEFDDVTIFPNPVDDGKLNLLFDGWLRTQPTILIYDTTGKTIGKWNTFNLSDQLILEVSNLPPGVYFLEITIEGRSQVSQFVVL